MEPSRNVQRTYQNQKGRPENLKNIKKTFPLQHEIYPSDKFANS